MAEKLQSTLIKSSIGVDKIKKSVMTFRKSINSTQKSAVNINTALVNSNRQKQQAIKLTVSNFQKRREAVRRREREDIIEASGISGAIRRQGKVIASSTKGFLGRILDFIGTLMVGWLINNLPVIISLGEQLISRMGKLFIVLKSFVGNVTTILSGFGSLLGGTIQNFMKFDFTDQQQLIDRSMSTIQTGILGIEKDFNDAIYLLSQPLDLGFDRLNIPEPGPEPAAPEGVPGGGGAGELLPIHKQALDIISGPESGGSYNAMNQGTIGDDIVGSTLDSKTKIGKNLTDMTIGEVLQRQQWLMNKSNPQVSNYGVYAAGRYQFIPNTLPGVMKSAGLSPQDKFSPENQDLMAVALLKERGIQPWTVGGSKYSAKEIQIVEQARRTPLGQPRQTTPSPVITSKSRVIDEINVSGPKGGLPDVGLTGGGGNYGAYRTPTRSHAGIDIGTSGQKGWLVGFRASGTVTYAAVAGGYGNLVIIKSGNTEYYFAHLARIMVRPGPYNGQVIGEIGNTGSGSGIHLHYEVRPNGKPIDPKPYLNLLDIGRKTAPTSTAISAAKPSTSPEVQIASAKPAQAVQSASQVTTERKGQTIVVPISMPDQSQVAQATPRVSGGSPSFQSPPQSGLNRYIEQTQYLALA
jgi:murein DD-endopeptidase MepM/ murein hydrolase activator NlpD